MCDATLSATHNDMTSNDGTSLATTGPQPVPQILGPPHAQPLSCDTSGDGVSDPSAPTTGYQPYALANENQGTESTNELAQAIVPSQRPAGTVIPATPGEEVPVPHAQSPM